VNRIDQETEKRRGPTRAVEPFKKKKKKCYESFCFDNFYMWFPCNFLIEDYTEIFYTVYKENIPVIRSKYRFLELSSLPKLKFSDNITILAILRILNLTLFYNHFAQAEQKTSLKHLLHYSLLVRCRGNLFSKPLLSKGRLLTPLLWPSGFMSQFC
jgi:hypothetical protein